MSLVILQSEVQHPPWPYGGSTATLRIYSSQNFYSEPEGVEITAGQVGSTGWAYEYTCTVNGDGNLVIPQVSLYATLDASPGTAKYTAVFFDSAGRKRNTKLSQFWLSPYSVDMSNESSVEVSAGGTAASSGIYTYRGQNNGKGYYNLDTYADSTSNRVVVWNGSQWRINSSAGARYYYSAEDVSYPWDVVTWTADTGSLPVPSVDEDADTVTSTWQDVTLANQAYVPNYNIVNTTWSPAQIEQYVTSLVGDGTTPFSSSLRCGKTFLDYDPDPSTNPVAISSTSPDWIAITEEVIWLSGREYENDFAAAVTGIGATPKTLIITESTNVTATVSVPSTLHLQFESGGKLNISSGQTVTIGSMNPCGSQQIFTGAGNAVFAKNATNGIFHLSWWSGISDSSSDLTTDFTQAATSLTNNTGGTLHIGPGVWKMDGMTVPSGAWIVGSGQNTNITSGTVIKPFSTSAVDLFTFSTGVDRSGMRNLTVSTDGTVSSSSRCIRVVGASGNTTFGLTLDEIHFQATLASSVLLHFDDSGSNYEMVDILINHPLMEVPASGTAIKWDSNNTLTTIVQPSIICAAGAKCYHVGEAGGGGGWIEVISGDERGLTSNASTQPTNRSITGSIDGATGVLTATSGAFVQNDVGQPFTRGAASGYIEDLLTSTTANTSYSGVSVAAGTLTMKRFVPSTLMAYCVWHIVGDHNTINIIGGADEGFRYFLINEAPTNVSPINVKGRTIQSTVSIEDPCVLVFENCALKSQTFIDSAAVTGSLFFHGCSWDRTTINSDGVPDSSTTTPVVITTPRVFGVHDGASKVYTDLSFHEDIQQQYIETRLNVYDRRDGETTPLAVFASASESGQSSIRIGKIDPYTWDVSLYYDFYRDDATDGWLQIQGNQAAPNKGIATNCNIQAVGSTFIGGVVSPAQITAAQHNYNPGDSSYLVRLTANGNYDLTGIGLTTTQRGGEVHAYVLIDNRVITWKNQSASSSAANRFQTDTNADILQAQYEVVYITYDATTSRWRVTKPNITGLTSNGTTLNIALLMTGTSLDLSSNLAVTGTTTLENALTVNGTSSFNDDMAATSITATTELLLTGGADLTFTGTSGSSKILLTDALANALAVAEAGNDYLRFVTTNSSEAVHALKPLLQITPTAGIGYGTGAGLAVTQGTSRTTGVTINAVCGAITLFSAAGSATPFSFTVTNSTVAATDTIIVSQKSGTDIYTTQVVSAVGAGSFRLTLANASGTTVETPVFSFSVIKAVAA